MRAVLLLCGESVATVCGVPSTRCSAVRVVLLLFGESAATVRGVPSTLCSLVRAVLLLFGESAATGRGVPSTLCSLVGAVLLLFGESAATGRGFSSTRCIASAVVVLSALGGDGVAVPRSLVAVPGGRPRLVRAVPIVSTCLVRLWGNDTPQPDSVHVLRLPRPLL
eukprot:SAG31_NODE_3907_length_3763_cov_18.329421_2_plen_166_part_00